MLSTLAAVLILTATLLVFMLAVGVLSWSKRQQVSITIMYANQCLILNCYQLA